MKLVMLGSVPVGEIFFYATSATEVRPWRRINDQNDPGVVGEAIYHREAGIWLTCPLTSMVVVETSMVQVPNAYSLPPKEPAPGPERLVLGFNCPDDIRVVTHDPDTPGGMPSNFWVQINCGSDRQPDWNTIGGVMKDRGYVQDVIDSLVEFAKINKPNDTLHELRNLRLKIKDIQNIVNL